MMKSLKNYFIAGLISLFPLVVTVIILVFIFQKLDILISHLVPLITPSFLPPFLMEKAGLLISIGAKILAFLIIVGAITLFGFFTSRLIGRKMLNFLEKKIFFHIPLVSSIYRTIKEINDVLFAEKKYIFKRVVMLEYPRRGIHCLGFVTAETPPPNPEGSSRKMLSVFIPTTPNPTSGFLALIPEEETTPLSIGIERALKLVISGGALFPLYKDELALSGETLKKKVK